MSANVRAKYVVDSKGRRSAVILPVKEFEALVRELEDLRDAKYVDEAEASADGFVELGELRRSLSHKKQ
jgi:hypothetical protein